MYHNGGTAVAHFLYYLRIDGWCSGWGGFSGAVGCGSGRADRQGMPEMGGAGLTRGGGM